MPTSVHNEKDLADAIQREDDTIEITGDLAKKIIRIRATGTVAWVVAFGAIGVAAYAAIAAAPTGGASAPVAGVSAVGAVTILGGSAAYSAIAIAIAAGGLGALTRLRSYKEISRSENKLVLQHTK